MNASVVSKKRYVSSRDTSFTDAAAHYALHVLEVSEIERARARIACALAAKSLAEKNEFIAALGLED